MKQIKILYDIKAQFKLLRDYNNNCISEVGQGEASISKYNNSSKDGLIVGNYEIIACLQDAYDDLRSVHFQLEKIIKDIEKREGKIKKKLIDKYIVDKKLDKM